MVKVRYFFEVKSGLNESRVNEAIESSLRKLKYDHNVEIEIILAEKSKIAGLNKKFRGITKPTDVLSFPQTQFKTEKMNILGSIVICPEIAEERGENLEELVRHGLLHLVGYDHETDRKKWDEAAEIINDEM